MTGIVRAAFGPCDPIVYKPHFGPNGTFYRWREWALQTRLLVKNRHKLYMPDGARASDEDESSGK